MATQSNNFILIEKDASSPIRGQQRSIDATDDIVLAPATVAIQPTGNVSINSTSGSLSMGDAASTQAINIGTNGARVITLGQGVGTGPTLVLNGATNTTIIESAGSLSIGSTYTGAETVNFASASGGALGYVRTLNIGSSSSTSSTNIYAGSGGTNVFGPFAVASTTSAISLTSTSGAITIDGTTTGTIGLGTAGGTGTISIGTAFSNRAITIGNATNTSALTLNAGSGGIALSTNATSGQIQIGADNGTGTISVATGTGARTLYLGTGGTGAKSIGLGDNSVAASVTWINGGSTGGINIGVTGFPGGLTGATPVNIATGGTAGTVSIGTGAATQILNVGTGGAAKTVTLGSTNTTSATTIQTGTGAMTFTAGGTFAVNATGATTIESSGGAIWIGSNNVANDVNIATNGSRFVSIGNTSSTRYVAIRQGARGTLLDVGTTYGMRGIAYFATNRTASAISDGYIVALQASPAADSVYAQVVLANANGGTANLRVPFGAAMNQGGSAWAAAGNGLVQKVGMFPVKFAVAPAGLADIGKPVYLSETDGQATLTAPSTSGRTIYRLGYLARGVADAAGLWYVDWSPQFIADIP